MTCKKLMIGLFNKKCVSILIRACLAQEVIFSRKSKKSTHPLLVFNNNNVSQTFSQKHLGVILDFK